MAGRKPQKDKAVAVRVTLEKENEETFDKFIQNMRNLHWSGSRIVVSCIMDSYLDLKERERSEGRRVRFFHPPSSSNDLILSVDVALHKRLSELIDVPVKIFAYNAVEEFLTNEKFQSTVLKQSATQLHKEADELGSMLEDAASNSVSAVG